MSKKYPKELGRKVSIFSRKKLQIPENSNETQSLFLFILTRNYKVIFPRVDELKLASFHELASVNKLADVLNANLTVRRFFEVYTRYFQQTSIRICEVKQTLVSGIRESRVRSTTESRVRSTTERLALRTPANFFTLASSLQMRDADDLQFLEDFSCLVINICDFIAAKDKKTKKTHFIYCVQEGYVTKITRSHYLLQSCVILTYLQRHFLPKISHYPCKNTSEKCINLPDINECR